MQIFLSHRIWTQYGLNCVRRQARIGYLAFDLAFVVIISFLFKIVYAHELTNAVLTKILEELQINGIDTLSLIQSFKVFLIYRVSLSLALLHTFTLICLWTRQRLNIHTSENLFLSWFEIFLALTIFLLSFWFPTYVIEIYSEISFYGSLLFLTFQIITCTRSMYQIIIRYEQENTNKCLRVFFQVLTFALLFIGCFSWIRAYSNLWDCKETHIFLNISSVFIVFCFIFLVLFARNRLYLWLITGFNLCTTVLLDYMAFLSFPTACKIFGKENYDMKRLGQIGFGVWSILFLLGIYSYPIRRHGMQRNYNTLDLASETLKKNIIFQNLQLRKAGILKDDGRPVEISSKIDLFKNLSEEKRKSLKPSRNQDPKSLSGHKIIFETEQQEVGIGEEEEETEEIEKHTLLIKTKNIGLSEDKNHEEEMQHQSSTEVSPYVYVLTLDKDKSQTTTQNSEILKSLIIFHTIMIFSFFYMAMLMTNWKSPRENSKSPSSLYDLEGSNMSFWIKMCTGWFNIFMHLIFFGWNILSG